MLYPALLLLSIIALFFLMQGGDFKAIYTGLQSHLFILLNRNLSLFPQLQQNITEIGDATVAFPLFIGLLLRWGALLNASLISVVTAYGMKAFFYMPRPARVIAPEDINIIGERLVVNSLPSGHSMTIFIFITLFLFLTLSKLKSRISKTMCIVGFLALGLFFASSRIAVGAHWPLDVLIGSAIGYVLAVIGIMLNNKYPMWQWLDRRKFIPLKLLIILGLFVVLVVNKIMVNPLPIHFVAGLMLVLAFYLNTKRLCSKENSLL